ncbi:MAG: CRISPR-associated endonuclease Cas1, partial [Deltaproteobacteria bacterium]|nr:CRISPR-associated endonuclease Cas1 [Deltaproteobacteria bacterium]
MAVLYVAEQGATVSRVRERLRVSKGPSELAALRLDELEQVVLCGNVQLTTQAIRVLLARGIDTAFLDLGGRFLGRLAGPLGKNIELRRLQHRRLSDPEVMLGLARRFVAGKIANCRILLQRQQRNRPDERIARALVAMRLAAEKVPAAQAPDELLGLEGQAAASYFGAFPALLVAPGIEFTRRLRRPPP